MKNLDRFFALLGVMSLGIGCTKEMTAPAQKEDASGRTVISVNLPDDSKTTIDYDGTAYSLVWSEGDCLVVNGVESEPLSSAAQGSKGAQFIFNAVLNAPYNVTYCGKAGSDDVVLFPAVQHYSAGATLDTRSTPLYAASSDINSVQLQHLDAVMKFTFHKADINLRSIVVTAKGGEPLSGEFKIGKTAQGILDGTISGTGCPNVSLDCGGVEIAEPVEFYLSIPAGSYAQGLEILVVPTQPDEGGQTAMTLNYGASSGCTFVPGKVYTFPSTEFEYNCEDILIGSVDELLAFGTTYGTRTASEGKTVKVIADIDASGAAYASPGSFYGTLDGCGHTISGLTVPLVGNLYGVAKNITLDSQISYTGINTTGFTGSDYGLGILCHYVYCYIGNKAENGETGAYVDNVTTKGFVKITGPSVSAHAFQIGGVSGASNGVPFTHCTNYADVTIENGYSVTAHTSGTTAYNLIAGGVVGTAQIKVDAEIIDCHNYGKVTADQSGAGEGMYVGGVVGYVTVASKLEDCTNDGDVELSGTCSKGFSVGGILGNSAGTNGPLQTNLVNRGKLTFSGSAAGAGDIGGIAGTPNNRLTTNVRNEGDIVASGTNTSYTRAGGIAGASILKDSRQLTNTGDFTISGTASYFFVGGIAGYQGGYTLLECYNSGNITFDGIVCTTYTGFAAGGIVGQRKGGHTLTGAVNDGNITVESIGGACSSCRYDIGGICGYPYKEDAASTYNYIGCINNGKISVMDLSKANPARVGGILGHTLIGSADNSKNGKLVMTDCVNNGEVEIVGGYAKEVFAGGIIADNRTQGTTENTLATLTGCINNGKVSLNGNAGTESGKVCLGGIIGQIHTSTCNTIIENCSNTATIGLYEGTTDSYRPSAGGILGLAGGSSSSIATVTIRNCSNSGNIERTMDASTATLTRTNSTNYPYVSIAGGIAGSLGFFSDGANGKCYVNATIENCTNSGVVSFNRKKGSITSTSAPVEANGDGENVYTGGIVGLSYSAITDGIVISCCTNNGKVTTNFGKNGGIVGMHRANTKVCGKSEGGNVTYCVSNAAVGHPGNAIGTTGTVYGYNGGISGYMFGVASNIIEYCSVTENCWTSGNYGSGGIVGAFCSNASYASPTIRYCKTKAIGRPSSTASALVDGGKSGLVFCNTPKKNGDGTEIYDTALANVSDIAVGGTVYKSASNKWGAVNASADNFMTYFCATTYCPDATWAASHNVFFWNGTDSTPWE